MGNKEIQSINTTDSPVVVRIKEKLNEHGGEAFIPLFQGDLCKISYDPNGKGLISPKIPPANQLSWKAFDAAVEVVVQNDVVCDRRLPERAYSVLSFLRCNCCSCRTKKSGIPAVHAKCLAMPARRPDRWRQALARDRRWRTSPRGIRRVRPTGALWSARRAA